MRAVVDIGSNSVKFLMASPQSVESGPHVTGSRVTRLGRGVHERGVFDPGSFRDTVAALESFAARFAEAGCRDVVVVGTSAVRDASDRDRLGAEVARIFGAPLQVLSGLEEAEASMKGAALAARGAFGGAPSLFLEVGGASSQAGMTEPAFRAHSFQAGAVRCHESLGLAQMPVPDEIWARARAGVAAFFPAAEWHALESSWPKLAESRAVLIGGSLVLAARLIGAKALGDRGYLGTRADLDAFNDRLRRLSHEERLAIPGMEAGRADILCAGLLCVNHLLELAGKDDFFVTGWGLRYGLLAGS